MALAYANVVDVQLEKVDSTLPVLYDKEDLFYSSIEKANIEVVSNKAMRIPLDIRPGGYFGHYDPDGGDLGVGDGPYFDEATISTVHLKHAIQWTKKAEYATDDTRKSVINVVRRLIATSMADFRRGSEALCMTAGDGVLGTVTTVSNDGTTDTYTLTTDGFGAKLLRYGQYISLYDTTLGTKRVLDAGSVAPNESKISYYDIPTKTIKCLDFASAVAGDKLVVSGLSATPPVSLFGVPYHQTNSTSGSWLGFTRSSTPEILSNRVTASGSLALSHARLAVNKIGDRLGSDKLSSLIAWCHPCQKQAYEELGQAVTMINKQGANSNLDLYYDVPQIAGITLKTSFMWDKSRIDFISPSTWGRAEMKPVGFHEVDGRKIFELRGTSGGVAASQVFYLTASWNLFTRNPAAGAYISDLSVPNGY